MRSGEMVRGLGICTAKHGHVSWGSGNPINLWFAIGAIIDQQEYPAWDF